MRSCALCKVPAKIFCESDQAALCWDCDTKVHGANFLVARHSRTLLCHACQCPTPWMASEAKLGNTVSVCDNCVKGAQATDGAEEGTDGGDGDYNMPEDGDAGSDDEGDIPGHDNDGDDDGSGENEESCSSDGVVSEYGDNQVVPWSPMTPPPAASSSSSDESLNRLYFGGDGELEVVRTSSSLKPRREFSADRLSQQF